MYYIYAFKYLNLMRLILLLCFFIVTTAANAQSGLLHINNFKPGYYYTNDGQKITGKIEKNADVYSTAPEDKYILFKTDTGKSQVLLTDIKAFAIGKDSFTVSHKNLTAYKVILNTPVKLYSYIVISNGYSPGFMGANGMMTGGGATQSKNTVYFYGAEPDSVVLIRRKNFIDAMSIVMAAKPNVVTKIKDKTYTMGWLDELLDFYNTGNEPPKQSPFIKGKH